MRKQTAVLYNMSSAYPSREIHYKKRQVEIDLSKGVSRAIHLSREPEEVCIISCSRKSYPRYVDYFALLASRGQKEGWFFGVKLLYLQLEREKESVNMQSYYL